MGGPFIAVVALVFGLFAWLQMPAVCGFMLSSTLVGAENYVYSIWLGALLAVIGLASSAHSLWRGERHPLLLAGTAASAGFIAFGLLAHESYGALCRAVYTVFAPL